MVPLGGGSDGAAVGTEGAAPPGAGCQWVEVQLSTWRSASSLAMP